MSLMLVNGPDKVIKGLHVMKSKSIKKENDDDNTQRTNLMKVHVQKH